jgi:hypothetical protein
MKRFLHQDLAKRAVKLHEHGKEYLRRLTKDVMVNKTQNGDGSDEPTDKQTWTIA